MRKAQENLPLGLIVAAMGDKGDKIPVGFVLGYFAQRFSTGARVYAGPVVVQGLLAIGRLDLGPGDHLPFFQIPPLPLIEWMQSGEVHQVPALAPNAGNEEQENQ